MHTEKKLTGFPSIDKPWLKYYNEKTIDSKTPNCSVYQNIYKNNIENLSDIALLFFGKKITYKQLFIEVDRAAKAFIANDIECGENVVLCMPAIPETIYAILALNKIGANAVMLNPLFTEEQLVSRISETDAKLMVVVNEFYGRLKKVIPKTTIKTIVSCAAINSLGTIIKILKRAKKIPNITTWNSFIKQGHNVELNVPEYVANRPAIMVYSSGTTGASKGIQLTNDSINSTITEGGQIGFEWKRGDRWFSQIPVWFSTGICAQTLVPLKYGITIILEPIYDFEIFYKHIIKYKPNFMITACGLLDYLMIKQPKSEAYKGFKFLCAGGEYVTPSAEKKYNDWLKANNNHYGFFKGYGMCECGGTVTASSPKSNSVGSAGIPTPNVVATAFNLETGKECKYGERGEIRVLTPCRMLEYYKNHKETAKRLYNDENGNVYVRTGDMGYVAEDGNIYICGRISDSYINNNGEMIYLFDIERAVLDVEGVRQCKVITKVVNGHTTHICHIVLDNIDTNKALIKIKKHCENALPQNHQPKWIHIYEDALPVAPSGKLDTLKMKDCTDRLIEL